MLRLLCCAKKLSSLPIPWILLLLTLPKVSKEQNVCMSENRGQQSCTWRRRAFLVNSGWTRTCSVPLGQRKTDRLCRWQMEKDGSLSSPLRWTRGQVGEKPWAPEARDITDGKPASQIVNLPCDFSEDGCVLFSFNPSLSFSHPYKEDKTVLWWWQWKMANAKANTCLWLIIWCMALTKVKMDDECMAKHTGVGRSPSWKNKLMDASKETQFQKSRPQIGPASQEGKWVWKRGMMIHHTCDMHFVFTPTQCAGILHLTYTFC